MFTKLNSVQTKYLQLSEKKCICKCVFVMKSRHRGPVVIRLLISITDGKLDRYDYGSKPIRSFRCAFQNDISRHFPLLDDLSKQF